MTISEHAKYLIGLAVEALLLAGVIAAIVGIVVTRRRERAQARAYLAATLADLPAGFDYPRAPVEHVGATEDWSPAAETAAVNQTPDLRTTGEQMVADHAELAGISDALDLCSERIMHELRLFLRDDTEYARIARWGTSVLEDTGTFNRRDLDRALAGAVA